MPGGTGAAPRSDPGPNPYQGVHRPSAIGQIIMPPRAALTNFYGVSAKTVRFSPSGRSPESLGVRQAARFDTRGPQDIPGLSGEKPLKKMFGELDSWPWLEAPPALPVHS